MRFLTAPVIIRHYFSRFREQLALLRHSPEPETIHHFRVNVKRLRAFLRLLRFYTEKDSSWKLPRSFKKMYSALGQLRDLQLMKEHGHNRELQAAEKQVNRKLLSPSSIRGIEHQLLKAVPDHVPLHVVRSFIGVREQAIHAIAGWPSATDEDLHQVRKHLKDLLYLIEIVRTYQPAARFQGFRKERVATLTTIAQELGNLNDLVTAIHWRRLRNQSTSTLLAKKKQQKAVCIELLQREETQFHAQAIS